MSDHKLVLPETLQEIVRLRGELAHAQERLREVERERDEANTMAVEALNGGVAIMQERDALRAQLAEAQQRVKQEQILADERVDAASHILISQIKEARRELAELLGRQTILDSPASNTVAGCVNCAGMSARLAKCVEALTSIARNTCCDTCQEAALVAKAALDAEEGK